MARPNAPLAPLRLLTENPAEVLKRLREGWIDYLEGANDQFTDEHVRAALQSGLLAECAAAFPDPRQEPEVPALVLLAASVAGAFQAEYALCQAGCALHSASLLAELGLNVAWLQPGEGISRRGTGQDAVFHADTLRKLLCQIAAADRQAQRYPGASLVAWWNEVVGPAFRRRAGGGAGVWILDATKLLVNLTNPRYEGSQTSKDEDGQPIRGYKLGLLSTLIDVGRLIVRLEWDGVRTADASLTRGLVTQSPPMEQGDTLLEDRGLIDGEVITCLKRDLNVDVVVPLKRAMLAYRLACWKAGERPYRWQQHPTRERQEIQRVEEIGGPWEECRVPLNACVVREQAPRHPEAGADGYRYWVFATTNRQRSGRGIIADYTARAECEEDHRQTKGPNWEVDEFTSTALVEVLYHVLVVLFAYNLCQWYGNTEAGQRFAGKTKRARQRELRRQRERAFVLIAGPYWAVVPEWDVAEVLLEVNAEARERLRALMRRLKAARKVGN
jgi:Transposase DDE domain